MTTTGSTAKAPRARKKTPEAWVDFIVARAEKLRAAGVLHVEFEGVTFVLAPAAPTEPTYEGADPGTPVRFVDEEPEPDPFDDPHTYGMSGRVPAFPRTEERDDD